MRPLEVENPGAGERRTGVKAMDRKSECVYYNRFSAKYQAICLLYFLTLLIPESGYFERSLSLAIDRAVVAWEGVA